MINQWLVFGFYRNTQIKKNNNITFRVLIFEIQKTSTSDHWSGTAKGKYEIAVSKTKKTISNCQPYIPAAQSFQTIVKFSCDSILFQS